MLRLSAALIAGLGVSISAMAQSQFQASDIQTDITCEAAFGMVSTIDGILTCTLPVMNSYEIETEEGVSSCPGGELVSNGTFCRVVIDDEYKNAEPDCAAVQDAKTDSTEGYDQWLIDVARPYTDAWKCERI